MVISSQIDEMIFMTPALTHLAQAHKALANPARLRVLAMLRAGELCACQIGALLELAPSTVSAHLAALRRGGLVAERRDGRWVHYRLRNEPHAVRLLDGLWPTLRADPLVRSDAAVLRRLRRRDVAELCRLNLDLTRMGIVRPVLARAGARS